LGLRETTGPPSFFIIARVLLTHPKIFDAGIVGVPDEKWGEVGKAFIVLKPGEAMGNGEFFEFLKGKVAKYKIPKYVELIEELPKTASGKIQKFVLKEWHKGRSTKFQAPSKEPRPQGGALKPKFLNSKPRSRNR
jgi:acyl-CoA synthetase (AMP-forming)/AMP-acid ligase II